MYTKSKIQMIKESLALSEGFKSELVDLMNKYTVEDSVFVYNQHIMEYTSGYFTVDGEYKTIDEAIRNCNINDSGIRIINNETFQVGKIHKFLSECGEEKPILDINCLETI